ncbi:MAG: tetratricopeptide repeat protein [Pseudomonadota bacterium]
MRYSIKSLRGISVVAALALLAGCAGGPGGGKSTERRADANAEVVPIAEETQREYNDALTLISVEDHAGAALILERFVAAHPEYPAAATMLAVCLRRLERTDDALALLQTTLAAHATHAPGWNELGILYRESGQFTESEAAYLKAVTADPDYPLAHFNFGILLDMYLARPEQALEHYERYQSLTPDEDKQVKRWIADISRRIQRDTQAAQVTQ